MKTFNPVRARALKAVAAAALGLIFAGVAQSAAAADADVAQHLAWNAAIANTPVPAEGCFTAAYPSTAWAKVGCVVAPQRPYVPRNSGMSSFANGAGDGNDYAAVVTGLISTGVGSFPTVTGVKGEKGIDGLNSYSIQLNSQFFASPTCSGAANPSSCLGWQQFVYTNEGEAFMQYWLINYNNTCPTGGWMAFGADCYRNSAGIRVPTQPITQLANLKVTGAAVAKGRDTVTMTTATNAYAVSGNDNVVSLANFWNASEFNVIGDGDGSAARFNKGSSVTVNIALIDGLTAAPVCQAHDGTTGETNNLNLGPCTVAGGTTPSVSFTESN